MRAHPGPQPLPTDNLLQGPESSGGPAALQGLRPSDVTDQNGPASFLLSPENTEVTAEFSRFRNQLLERTQECQSHCVTLSGVPRARSGGSPPCIAGHPQSQQARTRGHQLCECWAGNSSTEISTGSALGTQ